MDELRSLREARNAVEDQIQRMQWGLGPCPPPQTPNPAAPTVSPQESIVDEMSTRLLFRQASPLSALPVFISASAPPPWAHFPWGCKLLPPCVLPKNSVILLISFCHSLRYKHEYSSVCSLAPCCPGIPHPPPPHIPHPTCPPHTFPLSPANASFGNEVWLQDCRHSCLSLCLHLYPPPPPPPFFLACPSPLQPVTVSLPAWRLMSFQGHTVSAQGCHCCGAA